LNIKQLDAFLAIVEAGSFAAAADHLNLTQSTISARIQDLEEELDAQLFDRSKRRVQLTYRGRELVQYAERARNAFLDIRKRFGPSEPLSGIVRMGVAELIAVTWLPRLTQLVRNEYPQVTLQFEVSLNPELMERTRSGELDMAVIAGPYTDTSFCSTSLGWTGFSWMAAGHVQLPARALTPQDLAQQGVIFQGADSFVTRAMQKWLGTQDNMRHSFCNSMEAIASLTAAGVGVSLLSTEYYASDIAAGKLRLIDTDPAIPAMEFRLISERRNEPDALIEAITSLAAKASTFKRLES
jgi:DNA-binding transcriptional LysR family regulator